MGLGISIRVGGAPDDVAASALSAEVSERMGQPTSYRLEYSLDSAQGDFPLLKESKLDAGSEISIIVPAAGRSECLVKGPVYGQQIRMEQGGAGSTLSVLGADSLVKLDREDKVAAWSDLTDSSAVTSILSQNNFVPDVDTTQAAHVELKHTLIQRETDLAFIRRLARRNGNLFWLTCDETGVETAHFKRPVLSGQGDCELVINLTDPRSNVTSLEISWDVERPVTAQAAEVDLSDKSDITSSVQRSPLTALGGSALADIASGTRAAHVQAPVDDSGDLQSRAEAALIEASFFVRATGSTTLAALGKVLRSHRLVNLRGAGSRHSGLWFCSAVRHTIDLSEHRMEFELIRNGWTA
jgi:phage protein D